MTRTDVAGTGVREDTNGNGGGRLSPEQVTRLFEDGYREIEVLPDGTIREAGRDAVDETVTRTLKTQRTWY